MIEIQYDLYKYWEKQGVADTTTPSFSLDTLFPCTIIDIYSSLQGKSSSDLKNELVMMELDQLLPSIAKYVPIDDMDAAVKSSFKDWLGTKANIN